MNTRLMMGGSAAFMAALGLVASFAPQELLSWLGVPQQRGAVLITETVGALYLGFAYLNWMARGNVIGGIYSRPIALGNFLHFVVVSATLIRSAAGWTDRPELLLLLLPYAGFGAWFGIAVFRSPRQP